MTVSLFNDEQSLQGALGTVSHIAKEAGKLILKGYHATDANVYHKGIVDLVTDTDKSVEAYVIGELTKAYPETSFLAEESASSTYTLYDAPTWIIDPIDGTTNFVHKLPLFCVSIALSVNKQIVLGVIYVPLVDELFTAVKGKGAFLNGKPIHVAAATKLQQAVVGTNVGYDRTPANVDYITEKIKLLLLNEVQSIRSQGSAASEMVAVACGRLDVFYERGIHPWDIAAGSIIVTEAGGVVTDITGQPLDLLSRRVMSGNKNIVDVVTTLFNKAQ